MLTHKTTGIVLRTVKYGETSVISTVYTALFGVQSYIVKGVRNKQNIGGESRLFQPGLFLSCWFTTTNLSNCSS